MKHEFKGTLGPWKICGDKRGGCICGQVWSIPADFPVATATLSDDELGEIPIEQMKANARLIAAAPDLLEALQNLVQLREWKDKHGKDEHYKKARPIAWEAARAAISKALNHNP